MGSDTEELLKKLNPNLKITRFRITLTAQTPEGEVPLQDYLASLPAGSEAKLVLHPPPGEAAAQSAPPAQAPREEEPFEWPPGEYWARYKARAKWAWETSQALAAKRKKEQEQEKERTE